MPQKKILFCASTLSHIRNFHLPYLKAFGEMGYEVWVAANEMGKIPYAHHVIALPLQKKMTSPKNLSAIAQARQILKKERFDVLSVHTALAAAVWRAAALFMKHRPFIVNTVHGFLFGEKDGKKKWLYLLPEKMLAHLTDVQMVMNREDQRLCEKYHLSRHTPYYIDGMGVDFSRLKSLTPEQRLLQQKIYGIKEGQVVFSYAAEFSKRKNQEMLIRAFAQVCRKLPDARLVLAGQGILREECKALARELQMEETILFPGYVQDMAGLYGISTAAVTTSRSEGLPFNVMEAMACSLPVIATDIKGHQELVSSGQNGFLVPLGDVEALANAMEKLGTQEELARNMGARGKEMVEKFSLKKVFPQIMEIYKKEIQAIDQ